MMMGMEWWIWVVVVVVLMRLVTGPRRWRRGWLWDDDWLDGPGRYGRLPGRSRSDGGRRGAYRLERRRAALDDAADRLEEASERLRRKARRGGLATVDRRPSVGSSASPGSGRISGSRDLPDSGLPARNRVVSRKPAETRLATLQRRFAEGRITMEQYERELDKLYGLS